jgi:hypothetical protein
MEGDRVRDLWALNSIHNVGKNAARFAKTNPTKLDESYAPFCQNEPNGGWFGCHASVKDYGSGDRTTGD